MGLVRPARYLSQRSCPVLVKVMTRKPTTKAADHHQDDLAELGAGQVEQHAAQHEDGDGRAEVGLQEDQAAQDTQDDHHGDQAEGDDIQHFTLRIQPEGQVNDQRQRGEFGWLDGTLNRVRVELKRSSPVTSTTTSMTSARMIMGTSRRW